jgi:CrcB protein
VVLTIGLLGGFTTYSSFSYETVRMLEGGAWGQGALNVALTTALCLLACAAGMGLGRAAAGVRGGF